MVNLNPNELKDGDCESPRIQGWGFRMRVLIGFMMNVAGDGSAPPWPAAYSLAMCLAAYVHRSMN
eukprot:4121238-Prymnesium_polylepis.1